MRITLPLLIAALLTYSFPGFSSVASEEAIKLDPRIYHQIIAEALRSANASEFSRILGETSAQMEEDYRASIQHEATEDYPAAAKQELRELWEQVVHESSAISEGALPLPLLAQLVQNPTIEEKEEKLRLLAEYSLYRTHSDLAKNDAARTNLDLLMRILQASALHGPLALALLASLDGFSHRPQGFMEEEETSLYEKNIAAVLAKSHRSLLQRSLDQGAYKFAGLLLQLVFRYKLEIFAAEREAATQVVIPVASPLLEQIAQAMAARRKLIERHLQRLQHMLAPALRHCNSFWEYAVKYLPIEPFSEKSKQRVETGLLSAFPLHTTALQSEVLHYIELGIVRTKFLKLAGNSYLGNLLVQGKVQEVWEAIRYFKSKNSEFADVLAFSGERHLLLLHDTRCNLLLTAARMGNLGGIKALSLLVADGMLYSDSRGDNPLHIILADRKNSEKDLLDFLKSTLYAAHSNRSALVRALTQHGAHQQTPLQMAAEMGYESCLNLLMQFLREERAYDALEHGGSSYDLYKQIAQAKQVTGNKVVESAIMIGCRPIAPFSRANPKHIVLLQKISAQIAVRLARKLKAYQDSISEIYHPAFAEVYEFFTKELPHFSLSSPELQMGYLAGPLRQIVEKIDFDCDGSYLDAGLRYSYLCAGYESKLSQKMREAIKSFLAVMVK